MHYVIDFYNVSVQCVSACFNFLILVVFCIINTFISYAMNFGLEIALSLDVFSSKL